MRDEAFAHAVNEIVAFLGSKEVPLHTKAAWAEKVRHIPDEALSYIVGKITDECDNMPRNLPKVFKEKFRIWQMEHPEKTVAVEEAGCADCESGILFLERDGQAAAVFCQCYSGNAGAVGRTTLAYMQTQGWRSTKADKLGPEYAEKAHLRAQMAQARHDERHPDPARYDGYEDRFAEGW